MQRPLSEEGLLGICEADGPRRGGRALGPCAEFTSKARWNSSVDVAGGIGASLPPAACARGSVS